MPLSEPFRKMLASKSSLGVRVPLLYSFLVAAASSLSPSPFVLLSGIAGFHSSVGDGTLLLYSFLCWKFFVVVCFIILNPTAGVIWEVPNGSWECSSVGREFA